MGEIATTQLTPVGMWTNELNRIRGDLFSNAKAGNRIMSAFAMAEARAELMQSIKQEEIKAKLLRITDPEVCMVELANSPTPEDRARVCALAILTGFVPGDNEFSIFGGGGKPGKLFIKESGYRTLFGQIGVIPNVRTDHPEYVPFGTTGKKVWRVGGTASCEFQGQVYGVEFGGGENGIDFRLGINGYDSDNVAGIAAKARRQMLKMLWTITSPVLNSDHADDDSVIPQDDAPRIKSKEPELTGRELKAKGFENWRIAAQKRITDPEQLAKVNEYWTEIQNAKTKDALRLLHQDLQKNQVKALGKNNVDELCRWCAFCAEVLPA